MDNEHIVKAYDDELSQLDNLIAEMGGLCEVQLSQAVEAMLKRDVDLASSVIENDKKIDDIEHRVDSQAINLIALRQPMAEDLRMIIAALKVATNLERVGDQLYSGSFRELLTYMMEDPRNITSCTHQLFIAKNVERIGDHITGVAEQIIFVVSGEAPSEERPKDDSASFAVIDHETQAS